ncbi:diguanylate cyclase, partial [Acidobacteriia bacterium AH_259_A11_L15]|nr:diguanylate cyclase [Acidobacteriia bacterium AH_259_A11_L15]
PDRPRRKPKKPRRASASPNQVSVTVSMGVAEPDARHTTPQEVIQAADQALYRAKKAGRNRVKT